MQDNIILKTDSYKLSHYQQYPPGTEGIYSYFESRAGTEYDEVVFFGLQYILQKHLEGAVVTQEAIDVAEAITNIHLGTGMFNRNGWMRILDKHYGKLPVRIKAVPEGTVVPKNNVLMTIENTDPQLPWLSNYLETLLVQTWYPSTVATVSRDVKRSILYYLEKTGDPSLIDFKLHDFGFRGATTEEAAGIGGLAHLVNFKGSDTLPAIAVGISHYYSGICGHSIPASEHSTITSWGKDREVDAFRNMLQQYPTSMLACVSDSFDIFKACEDLWGTQLHEEVLSREHPLVVRPDSGEIVSTVLKVLSILGDKFGYTLNKKQYKLLNPAVRIIQSDGCSPKTIAAVLDEMEIKGWSADNIVFGMGGGLLQKVNRDTAAFAFKCSAINIGGVWSDVWKDPVTDTGKRSKRGRLALKRNLDGQFTTLPEDEVELDQLQTVFENGEILKLTTLNDIRKNAKL